MRAAAHLGAQGRLVRGFADRCEESLFKEPLADNKEWLLLHQRHVAYDPMIDEDDDPAGHAASERVVRQPGAAARDWQKYVKFIEFGMRRLPIVGDTRFPRLYSCRARRRLLKHLL